MSFKPELITGIIVDDFDSRKEGLWLQERSSPYPEMKETKEPLAFAHGDVDFSHVLGEFFYENRPLEYSFYLLEKIRESRYTYEMKLQNSLQSKGFVKIYDTTRHGYYYMGKCVNVSVTDDHVYKRLLVTIAFDVYPFMISELPEGHDIWDETNFELDVFQPTEFEVIGSKDILLINSGSTSIAPTVITDAPFTIRKKNVEYKFGAGTTKEDNFRLMSGENHMTVEGNGNIEFKFFKELI